MSFEASDSRPSKKEAQVPNPNAPTPVTAARAAKRRGGITFGPSDDRVESPWVTFNWIAIPLLITLVTALALTQ